MRRKILALAAAVAFTASAHAGPPSTPGYLVVPIRGVLGQDCSAAEIRRILDRALADEAVGTIVIELDATDGSDQAGIDVARAVTEASSRRRIVAWVENCAGPALPVLLACPAAYSSAADPSRALISCTIEADASAAAARERMRAALAAAAGTDPLRRAHAACFIDPQSRLYAWRDALGEYRASVVPPARHYPGMIDLGVGGGVSLTTGQAMATGLVRPAEGIAVLGSVLAEPDWWPVTRLDPAPTQSDAPAATSRPSDALLELERAARSVARLGAMVAFAEDCTVTAFDQPPPRCAFKSGKWILIPESVAERAKAWDEALAAWQAIAATLDEVDRLHELGQKAADAPDAGAGTDVVQRRGLVVALAALAGSAPIRADLRSTTEGRIREIESARVR